MDHAEQESDIFNYAIRLLARREYSECKLRMKLELKYSHRVLIDRTINKVQELGYQSDLRYAENFVSYSISRKKGPIWIRVKMREKGLHQSLVDHCLQGVNVDWQALANDELAKKYTTIWVDQKEKSRRYRFLMSKGFDTAIVTRALEQHERLLAN